MLGHLDRDILIIIKTKHLQNVIKNTYKQKQIFCCKFESNALLLLHSKIHSVKLTHARSICGPTRVLK